MSNATAVDGGVRKGKLGQRIAYACGNLGQSAFYNGHEHVLRCVRDQLPVLWRR